MLAEDEQLLVRHYIHDGINEDNFLAIEFCDHFTYIKVRKIQHNFPLLFFFHF